MLMAYSNGRCNESQDKCQQAKVSIAGLDLWVCTGIDSWQIKGLRDMLAGSNSARSLSFKAQPVSCIRPSESNVSPISTKDGGALIMTLDHISKLHGFVRRQVVW